MHNNKLKAKRFLWCTGMIILLALMSCPVKQVIKSYFAIQLTAVHHTKTGTAEKPSLQESSNATSCSVPWYKIENTLINNLHQNQLIPLVKLVVRQEKYFSHAYHAFDFFDNGNNFIWNSIPSFLKNKRLLI